MCEMRLRVVLRVDEASEIHRPRWEPVRPFGSELHVTISQHGSDAHLVFSQAAVVALVQQLEAILDHGCDDT
jgi:hypothetical protein